jgi:predicted HTH domain antitoxin
MSVTLEIPDDLLARLETDRSRAEADLLLEIAIALYREGKLPPRSAADLAGLNAQEFESVLIRRQVPIPYSLKDLAHDVQYARSRD